jgi:hypothetical protein
MADLQTWLYGGSVGEGRLDWYRSLIYPSTMQSTDRDVNTSCSMVRETQYTPSYLNHASSGSSPSWREDVL